MPLDLSIHRTIFFSDLEGYLLTGDDCPSSAQKRDLKWGFQPLAKRFVFQESTNRHRGLSIPRHRYVILIEVKV
jgi:hypothetical protein